MRWLPFSLLAATALLSEGLDPSILSTSKQEQIRFNKEKVDVSANKLEDTWINPITVKLEQSATTGGAFETESTAVGVSISQDIFRSGGIYFAIKYAKANRQVNETAVESQTATLVGNAYQTLFQLRRTELAIAKQERLIENARLDIKRKREQYLNGLLDSSYLDNAVLNKNTLENALLDLKNQREELGAAFANLSDTDPATVALPELGVVDRERFMEENLAVVKAEYAIQEKNYYKKMTISQYLPKISVSYGYTNYLDYTQTFGGRETEAADTSTQTTVALSMPLNINTFRDIEVARLDYLIAQREMDDRKREEQNAYGQIMAKVKRLDEKIALARESAKLYGSLVAQTQEQLTAGLKTEDDLATMTNSLENARLDARIYEIDRQIVLLDLYMRIYLGRAL